MINNKNMGIRNFILFLIGCIIFSLNSCFEDRKIKTEYPILKGKYLGQKPPNDIPVLFAPGIISTKEYNDRDLTISLDGKQMFFSRSKTGNSNDYNYDILFVEFKDSAWTKPTKAWFSSEYGEVEPFFTADGKQLFFNSNRPMNDKSRAQDWETWFIAKEGTKWTEPKVLQAPFNRVCHTTFTNDKMYYTKENIPALFYAEYKNGIFGKPVKLDAIINATKREYNCFIAPDETYLIFTRQMDESMKNSDLFISYKGNNDQWSEPKNMGQLINSDQNESCPNISNDGKYFFFSSNRKGNFDIYWVSIKYIENLRRGNKND